MDYVYVFLGILLVLIGYFVYKYPKPFLEFKDKLGFSRSKEFTESMILNMKVAGIIIMVFGGYIAISIIYQLITM